MPYAPGTRKNGNLAVMNTNLEGDMIQQSSGAAEGHRPRLLTKAEVAMLIRKSQRTVEHWVNAGYLSCIRISHSVLFDREQVIADLKRFETNGPGHSR